MSYERESAGGPRHHTRFDLATTQRPEVPSLRHSQSSTRSPSTEGRCHTFGPARSGSERCETAEDGRYFYVRNSVYAPWRLRGR